MLKKYPSSMDRVLKLITVTRLDQTYYLFSFPMQGDFETMVTEKVTRPQLENILRAASIVGRKITRAFQSKIPPKKQRTKTRTTSTKFTLDG